MGPESCETLVNTSVCCCPSVPAAQKCPGSDDKSHSHLRTRKRDMRGFPGKTNPFILQVLRACKVYKGGSDCRQKCCKNYPASVGERLAKERIEDLSGTRHQGVGCEPEPRQQCDNNRKGETLNQRCP